jgi:hypothetical protein
MVNMDSNSTLDAKYSGQITVSDYRVVFVLPKEFPPQQGQEDRDDDGGYLSRINPVMSAGASKRRLSISDRPVLHFMVAIEAWIPLATKPPRAPFMVGTVSLELHSEWFTLHLGIHTNASSLSAQQYTPPYLLSYSTSFQFFRFAFIGRG